VLDNLGSNKSQDVRQAVRNAGARLIFLPLYNPDLNPIEQVFAKLKTLLRRTAARNIVNLMINFAVGIVEQEIWFRFLAIAI
jgi:transposase